ncbi:hypothetical protein POM88_027014 [Heracleum sosnowskyi]|uniref:t-SNARE coiled-coil homology domain-containing protein n=1 Tax=Heracleum sosnowskyi TaxID=360622 RepID=A0AAD8I7T5_9APIA|nr:hypothetical protein POM88_027014 [Heracleum sosnowskyi]
MLERQKDGPFYFFHFYQNNLAFTITKPKTLVRSLSLSEYDLGNLAVRLGCELGFRFRGFSEATLVHEDLMGKGFSFSSLEYTTHEVLLLDNEISFNEAIIDERDQGIQEIQDQIGEVNEIFKDLVVLIHEQGVMIDDIGSHVENAHAATTQGKSQLVRATKTQKSNSSLVTLYYLPSAIFARC